MARLLVRKKAEERGMNLSQLQIAVSARLGKVVPLGTLRRYWHSTMDGKETGRAIELVDVYLLGTISKVLDVSVAELLNEAELGQMRAAPSVA